MNFTNASPFVPPNPETSAAHYERDGAWVVPSSLSTCLEIRLGIAMKALKEIAETGASSKTAAQLYGVCVVKSRIALEFIQLTKDL